MKNITASVVAVLLSISLVVAEDAKENLKRAQAMYQQGEYNEALGFVNKSIVQDSSKITSFFFRAETFLALEQYYNAILDINRIFKMADSITTEGAKYYLLRAKSFLGVDDRYNAGLDLDRALALEEDNAEVHYNLARIAMEDANYSKAMDCINDAIKYDAGIPDFYTLRAEVKTNYTNPVPGSEEYNSIIGDINVAIALAPEDPEYLMARSNFLNSMGEVEAALDDYNQVIALSPKKEQAYTERGVIKMNNYDYRSAVLDFTKSIIINPEDERNYRFRGLCYNNLDNFSGALKDFTKSIDILLSELEKTSSKDMIKNKLGETYILRGHCLNLMGNNAQACRDFLYAHNLGVRKGLNYYRKFCGIY